MTRKDGVFTLKLDDGITPSCLEVSSGMSPGVSLAEIGIWPADDGELVVSIRGDGAVASNCDRLSDWVLHGLSDVRPLCHSEPVVGRGRDLRSPRSASACVRQFSHNASNLSSSLSSSSAKSLAERSLRSLRISCMVCSSVGTKPYVSNPDSACKGSILEGPDSVLAMSRRLGILCAVSLG